MIVASPPGPEVGDLITLTATAPGAVTAPQWSVVPAASGRIDAKGGLVAFEPGHLEVVADFGAGTVGRLDLEVRAANPASFGAGRYLGGSDNDSGVRVVIDADGSVYLAGSTAGYLVDDKPAEGTSDAYVARVLANGKLAWITMLPTVAIDGASGLALHPAGGVVVSGAQLLGSTAARIDRTGTIVWRRDLSGLGVAALAVDKSGNTWLTGGADRASNYAVKSIFGPPLGEVQSGGASDGFLLELDEKGEPRKGKLFTWFSPDQDPGSHIPCFATDGTGIAIDEGSSAVYLSGAIQANAFFGVGAWVRRFDLDLGEQWLRFINGDGVAPSPNEKEWDSNAPRLGNYAQTIALGKDGSIYVGGTINDKTAFVIALAPDGGAKWRVTPTAKELGEYLDLENVPALVYRPRHDDLVFIRQIAGEAYINANAHSAIVTTMSTRGVLGASRSFGGERVGTRENTVTLRALALDPSENVVAAGDTTGTFFGLASTPGPGGVPSLDAMLVRFPAD